MGKYLNMKKLTIFFVLLLCVSSSYSKAYAALGFHIDFGQDENYESIWPLSKGEEVSIDVYVSGVPDAGLRAMGFVINYDFSKFQIISEGTSVNDLWTGKFLDKSVPGKIDMAGFKIGSGVVGVGGKDIKLGTIQMRRLQSGGADLILSDRGATVDSFVLADEQGTVLDGDIPEEGVVLSTIIEKGDVNADGNINLSDAIIVLKLMMRISVPASHLSADVNGDGKIGMAEAIYILQDLAGLR